MSRTASRSDRGDTPNRRPQRRFASRVPRTRGRRRAGRHVPVRLRVQQPGTRLRRNHRRRQGGAARAAQVQRRDRVVVQRHAVGPSAVPGVPGLDQGRRPRRRRRVPVRGRRARDVRRHHPGPRRHGAVAVQPRRHRDVHRCGPVARDVRRRGAARRVRQDRAGPADRRAVVRPPAVDPGARGPDVVRPVEQGEGPRPAALRRGQGDPRRPARRRGRVVPLPRHLHVLRHGELEPDGRRGHGPAPAGRVVRAARHAVCGAP